MREYWFAYTNELSRYARVYNGLQDRNELIKEFFDNLYYYPPLTHIWVVTDTKVYKIDKLGIRLE